MGDEHLSDEALAAWSEGTATAEQVARMTAHVATCDGCRTVLSELTRASAKPSVTVGRYELREKVGAGGMGAVWSAWDPKLARRVAVKLSHAPRPGGDARFVHERQILAGLEHPHIARLLDAGETADQRAWFAMDFVDGVPIDEFCARRGLSVRQRVELLLPVLAAVQHAHRHLVVHRDLKPANILVDAQGQPRLVDFGIARLLEHDLRLTETGHNPMTPAWASPEQVRGEPVTTSSDLFSLGVVLYELLSGASPWRVANDDVRALLEAIREVEPLPCSRAARSPEVSRALAGDLDAVLAMALRKDPKDRYSSVDAFAEDLRAWLDGRPTLARRGDRRYRFGRFVRRHRLAVGAGVAVFLSLATGLVATAHQARVAREERDRAERRFAQVRALAHAVLFDYHDGIADLPGSTALRERLVKDALGYLDSLAAEAQSDLSLQRELSFAYLKVGDVQGDPFGASLGDTEGALRSYLRGRALAQGVLAGSPGDASARRALALSEEKVGAIDEVAGRLDDAAASYERARALGLGLAKEGSDPEQRLELSRAELALAQVRLQQHRLDDALAAIESCVATRRGLVSSARAPAELTSLAKALNTLGDVRREQGQGGEALRAWEEALALFDQVVQAAPDSASAQRGRSVVLASVAGGHLAERRHDRALEFTTRALSATRRNLEADPLNVVARRDLAATLLPHAQALAGVKRFDDALAALDEARLVFEQLAKDDPTALGQRDLIACRTREAYTALDGGQVERALRAFEFVRTAAARLLEADAGNGMVLDWLADGHFGVGSALRLQRRFGPARAALRQSREALEKLRAVDPASARVRGRWALTEFELGRVEQAEHRGAEACTAYRAGLEALAALEQEEPLMPVFVEERDRARAEVARCSPAVPGAR
ncbi:MAG: protein kinase domain-containing protein [Myxococcota bacterium]